MRHRWFLIVVVVAACGYQTLPQLSGTDAPTDVHSGSDVTDCSVSGACATGVCDVALNICVACIDSSTCSGTAPVCNNDVCEACASHADCPESNTCLPSGACAASTDVAYVNASSGTGTTCTKAAPCATLQIGLSQTQRYVHLTGTVDEAVSIASGTKTIIGERTAGVITSKISNTAHSPLVLVSGTTTDLTLVDIAVVGMAINTDGIQVAAGNGVKLSLLRCVVSGTGGTGIDATGGTIDIDRSSITQNTTGGLFLGSTIYHVTNTFVANNGGTSSIGGVELSQGSGTIDFSTITTNFGPPASAKGINCTGTVGTITNTIIASNANMQTGGGCSYAYSDSFPTDANTPTGNHNLAVNPSLDGTNHLMTTSSMIDAADPAATLDIDFDGTKRPQGAARDIGADELMP